MLKIINLSRKNNLNLLTKSLEKRRNNSTIDTSIVIKILEDIKINKIKAVLKYEKKFSSNIKLKPSSSEIKNSIKKLKPEVIKSIDEAYLRIKNFHNLQKSKDIKLTDRYNNKIEYKNFPINSVGIYVPANLPSTLLMTAIPAKIAGVKNIFL